MGIKHVGFSKNDFRNLQIRLREWKNKYAGQRCFCVGNGPSLRETPLELLKDEYTFGLNNIAKIFPYTTWKPSFYVNVTVGITDPGWAESAKIAMVDTPSFIYMGSLPYVLHCKGNRMDMSSNVYPIDMWKDAVWRDDITEGVTKHGSSMLAVMQIAAYMGFNPIYLLGCDCKWEPFDYDEDKDPNHFVDSYWGKLKIYNENPVYVDQENADYYSRSSQECHTIASQACRRLGIKVYNATVGGKLEIYPRVDLADIL